MKRGDIVIIRYPYTDLSSDKVRPALIVSSNNYTRKGQDAIFLAITSNVSNPQNTDILIDQNDSNFENTGLKKSSLIKVDKIASISKDLVVHKLPPC